MISDAGYLQNLLTESENFYLIKGIHGLMGLCLTSEQHQCRHGVRSLRYNSMQNSKQNESLKHTLSAPLIRGRSCVTHIQQRIHKYDR
jgi:hypothetical protein